MFLCLLPFELIEHIYMYCNIDTQLFFHKIFNYKSFRSNKLIINSDFKMILESIYKIRFIRYTFHYSLLNALNNRIQ